MPKAKEVLEAPWPDGVEEYWRKTAADTNTMRFGGMRHRHLPLLQLESYVQCDNCSRTVLAEAFANHKKLCATLPIDENSASPDADSKARSRTAADDNRPQRARSAPKAHSPPPPPVNLDVCCGVKRGQAGIPCDKPLNCKYHGLALKRLVEGRSRPFEELYAAQHARGGASSTAASASASAAARADAGAPSSAPSTTVGPPVGRLEHGASAPTAIVVVPPPDPKWQAEWIMQLRAMPPYEESAAHTLAGHRAGWPEPIPGGLEGPKPKCHALWGVPFSALAEHPDVVAARTPRAAKRTRADAALTSVKSEGGAPAAGATASASGGGGWVHNA